MKKLAVLSSLLITLSIGTVAFPLERQPNSDYRARRQALSGKIKDGYVLLFAPPEAEGPNDLYGYRPYDNFFYLTGWTEPGAALLIAAADEAQAGSTARRYTEILFLPSRNPSQEQWTGPKLGPDNPDAPRVTGFDHVEALDNLRNELLHLLGQRPTVYTDVPGYGETPNSTAPLEWLKQANAFPVGISFQDVRPMLSSLRTFKDAGEIELIRKATNASIAAQLAAMHAMKPGISEREISALVQYEWGKRGCERPAYAPIVGAGANSTVLHYSDDSGSINAGDLVVIDAAGEYSMYASDITRTLPASGTFTPRQREIYNIVLGAQQAAIAAFQSGKSTLRRDTPDSLHKIAFDYINSHGQDLHGNSLGKYFVHGLSHYVGLNVHDPGDYAVKLGPGAVFTIEPGIYIPEEKLGVRIEDIFYVDPNGKLINLTESLPHTAEDVERTMAGK
ncbi:MAG: aminopeptidase P N-terminal domain-containing protein [Terriglobales bacterium]|jgi:Xaa-Pro aminopeptidase|nr:aminopeptidase P N-terminal domain-containing protein [Terriglobales bacterium]